jgi:hypothetical protein
MAWMMENAFGAVVPVRLLIADPNQALAFPLR